jgi:RNA polymerase sigma-54 factor
MSSNSLRLNLKVAQKQILTPGLVQMVSVLVLNKLELKEMINQEMVENPILEEVLDDSPMSLDDLAAQESREAQPADQDILKAEGTNDPFEDIDFGSFFRITSIRATGLRRPK